MQLHLGDSLDVLKTFPANSIDSLVTDCPSGIFFMGREWDSDKGGRDSWIAWLSSILSETLRVLKPGSHALIWALPRTSHWTATAAENAGFEIRDIVTHIFGTGFPKSTNHLKPATEYWLLCRKPLAGSAKANITEWGTGGLNINGSRIGTEQTVTRRTGNSGGTILGRDDRKFTRQNPPGRWPANLLLSHDPACTDICAEGCPVRGIDEQGEGASRYFYCAKASKADKGKNNHHPTVKSTKLMEYLIGLVTPVGGTVIDPFMGSGSTGVAALKAGYNFVGIEQDEGYYKLAETRLKMQDSKASS